MNSDKLIETSPSTPPGQSITKATESSKTSSQGSKSWNDAPLESIVLEDQLLHNMSPEELTAFVQRCNLLRSSAQSRKASLRQESGVAKVPKKKKSNVELAMELLERLRKEHGVIE
jgi:hypothetical protein